MHHLWSIRFWFSLSPLILDTHHFAGARVFICICLLISECLFFMLMLYASKYANSERQFFFFFFLPIAAPHVSISAYNISTVNLFLDTTTVFQSPCLGDKQANACFFPPLPFHSFLHWNNRWISCKFPLFKCFGVFFGLIYLLTRVSWLLCISVYLLSW